MKARMISRMEILGARYFDDTPVTVTDPCYDRDTWCIVDGVQVLPGDYKCAAYKIKQWYKDGETGKHIYYEIISGAAIYHADYINQISGFKRELIGDAGVDAGLCGFYQNKPDYSDDEWYKFCNKIKNRQYLITDEGFCTSSGYGDGDYDVYAVKNDSGDIVGLEIVFI